MSKDKSIIIIREQISRKEYEMIYGEGYVFDDDGEFNIEEGLSGNKYNDLFSEEIPSGIVDKDFISNRNS